MPEIIKITSIEIRTTINIDWSSKDFLNLSLFAGDNPAAMHHDHVNGSPSNLQIIQKWPIWASTILAILFITRHNWLQMDVFHTS